MATKRKKSDKARTDLSRWRLQTVEGAHRWLYLTPEDARRQPQSFSERYFLGLPVDNPILPRPDGWRQCAENGLLYYQSLQLDDGHWGCSYGGPSFLLPGLVFALYISDTPIPEEWKVEMIAYLAHHVNDDGGWGLHSADTTTVFATALYYVTLRILGLEASDPLCVCARKRLHALGGAIGVPQWGKFWLSCLNLYKWEGVNPVPSEFWLLPDWVPAHPWRWWVQCRVVYLPTSYLYTNKCQKSLLPLLEQLRDEIYVQPFDEIQFGKHRDTVASVDMKKPPNPVFKFVNPALRLWETYLRPSWLHKAANATVRDLIRREDENTSYNDLAPVSKAFHVAAVYFADGPDSTSLAKHLDKLPTYLWQSAEGMTCSGTNGAQIWDTSFTVIAVVEAGLGKDARFKASMSKALDFLDKSQFRTNLDDPYRQQRKGGWPFSTKDNGYIVSDCAAESMKAVILLQQECDYPKFISTDRLQDCVDTILTLQNPDGGFGSYERARGGPWMEHLNPAEVFDRIMVEYSYPECTTAVLTSLALFRKHFRTYRAAEIDACISRAGKFIIDNQNKDGSWEGSWGICYTYGILFALEAMAVLGHTYRSSAKVRKACDWLVDKQKEDGGWGEHFSSCELRKYVQYEKSQVVNTAWAVLALISAEYPDRKVLEKGLKVIKERQQPNGEWLQEAVEGVFNRTCMIGYPNYKFYFPIRALGRFEETCQKQVSEKTY